MLYQKNLFLRLKQWRKIKIKITYHTKSKIKGNDHLIFTVRYASFLKKIFVVKFYRKKFDMKDAKKKPNNNPSLHFSANDFEYIDRLFMYKKLSDFSKRIKLSVLNNMILDWLLLKGL